MTINFYGTRGPYGCFSNFSRHPVFLDGKRWPTSEHYFQAMKFPDNPERQELVRLAKSPGQSKKIGWRRDVPIRPDWDVHRDQVMLEVLRAKFTQHDELRETLLGTGEQKLVEHTSRDFYWGDGGDGSGQNKLGELLMQVRDELRSGPIAGTDGLPVETPGSQNEVPVRGLKWRRMREKKHSDSRSLGLRYQLDGQPHGPAHRLTKRSPLSGTKMTDDTRW